MVRYREIFEHLTRYHVDFIVICGVAAALHGSPMATFDVDVCTTFEPENLARIIAALIPINPRLRMRPDKMKLPLELNRLQDVKNLSLLTDLGILDLLGELPHVCSYRELAGKTVNMDLGGFDCRVLDLQTLITAKKIAGRSKDQAALMHLHAIKKCWIIIARLIRTVDSAYWRRWPFGPLRWRHDFGVGPLAAVFFSRACERRDDSHAHVLVAGDLAGEADARRLIQSGSGEQILFCQGH